jgi:hypothetical protein
MHSASSHALSLFLFCFSSILLDLWLRPMIEWRVLEKTCNEAFDTHFWRRFSKAVARKLGACGHEKISVLNVKFR